MEQDAQYIQRDFFSLLPGSAGGRALLEKYGTEYFRVLGQKAAHRPDEERHRSAQQAAQTRLRRLYTTPRTVISYELDEAVIHRVIPYWPARSRRCRPVWVKIELARRRVPGITLYYEHLLVRERRSRYILFATISGHNTCTPCEEAARQLCRNAHRCLANSLA